MRRLRRDMLRFSPLFLAAAIMFVAACAKQNGQLDASQYVTTEQMQSRDQGLVVLFQRVTELERMVRELEARTSFLIAQQPSLGDEK